MGTIFEYIIGGNLPFEYCWGKTLYVLKKDMFYIVDCDGGVHSGGNEWGSLLHMQVKLLMLQSNTGDNRNVQTLLQKEAFTRRINAFQKCLPQFITDLVWSVLVALLGTMLDWTLVFSKRRRLGHLVGSLGIFLCLKSLSIPLDELCSALGINKHVSFNAVLLECVGWICIPH